MHGKARRPWQELIRASMKQVLRQPSAGISKQEEVELECEMVRHLMAKYPRDTPRQVAESGLSRTTYYERRRKVKRAV